MIEQANIHAKYNELYEQYVDLHIDDYDVFVRSRVVEYFLNNSQEVADDIVALIVCALASNNVHASLDATQEEKADYCADGNHLSKNIESDVSAENEEMDYDKREVK